MSNRITRAVRPILAVGAVLAGACTFDPHPPAASTAGGGGGGGSPSTGGGGSVPVGPIALAGAGSDGGGGATATDGGGGIATASPVYRVPVLGAKAPGCAPRFDILVNNGSQF